VDVGGGREDEPVFDEEEGIGVGTVGDGKFGLPESHVGRCDGEPTLVVRDGASRGGVGGVVEEVDQRAEDHVRVAVVRDCCDVGGGCSANVSNVLVALRPFSGRGVEVETSCVNDAPCVFEGVFCVSRGGLKSGFGASEKGDCGFEVAVVPGGLGREEIDGCWGKDAEANVMVFVVLIVQFGPSFWTIGLVVRMLG
jgi:hypothetical protein